MSKSFLLRIRSKLFKEYPGTNRATYLRAIAALGVLVIHYDGMGSRRLFEDSEVFNQFWNNLIDWGGKDPLFSS